MHLHTKTSSTNASGTYADDNEVLSGDVDEGIAELAEIHQEQSIVSNGELKELKSYVAVVKSQLNLNFPFGKVSR